MAERSVIQKNVMLRVQFDLAVPVDATEENVREWLAFELGSCPQMGIVNPLSDCDLQAERDSIFVVTTGFRKPTEGENNV